MLKSLPLVNILLNEDNYYIHINKDILNKIKKDLILLEELIKLINDFELPNSLYLIGYYQAKIKEREGSLND